jgi:hypothetical protein
MRWRILAVVPAVLWLGLFTHAQSPAGGTESFFTKSLHYTNRGLEYVYSKEQGGVERILGKSAAEAGCVKPQCHVKSCDVCHKEEKDGKAFFSVQAARSEKACYGCHGAPGKDNPDVHLAKGMKCMQCHTAREIHGDGTAVDTYMKPGVLDARCENCHKELSKIASHTVHGGKVACGPCHIKDLPTCFNCHYETSLAGGKEPRIKRGGLLFLVNHDSQVNVANFLTHVYQNKTMITLAHTSPQTIVRQGRPCEACHGTDVDRQVQAGTFAPISWKKGEIVTAAGVVPVVENMTWNVTFFGREGEKWVPLMSSEKPLVNFSGYCSPLTAAQFEKLLKPQKSTTAAR